MKLQLYTPVYALTLLLSAALLFVVQPMFSKMILPLLGGTPQVWNTAMLFFQVALLAGYGYAHGTSKLLSIRVQALLHLVLLVAFVFVLPLAIPEGWLPPVNKDPTLWQLSLMFVVVGGPFFVLSGSAPMLQRWFSGTDHPDADNPYFLYGASNLGSMTSLLAYPVIIEPLMNLSQQAQTWMYGYIALIVCVLVCAGLVWTTTQRTPVQTRAAKKAAKDKPVNWGLRFKWLILAFIPSSLMLGVTTFITTDVAAVPLLWIIPLALYVGTFIIVFSRNPVISREKTLTLHSFLMIILIGVLVYPALPPLGLMGFHIVLFFFTALMCHFELAALRPSASHLTEFYLVMSIGGALGGVFNALIAPQFFVIPIEYTLVLVAACFVRRLSEGEKFPRQISSGFYVVAGILALTIASYLIKNTQIIGAFAFFIIIALTLVMDKRWFFALGVLAVMLIYQPGQHWANFPFSKSVYVGRNFFGVLRIFDYEDQQRVLLHGTTNHGTQALIEKYRLTPLSYYSPDSPLSDIMAYMDTRPGKQDVAVIGLGVGVTACYSKNGRSFDFYEIDPEIVRIAEDKDLFTFLFDCGSPYEIILGDGRLTLKNAPDKSYDLLIVDAFSSDNIPIHLLTLEAIELYLSKIKDNGILTFNISNNYIDLEPVLAEAAEELGIEGFAHIGDSGTLGDSELEYYAAHFFTMSKNKRYINFLEKRDWTEAIRLENRRVWTDQYSNIVRALGSGVALRRAEIAAQKSGKSTENTEK